MGQEQSTASHGDREHTPNQNRSQQVLNLLQNPEHLEQMISQGSRTDVVNTLKEINEIWERITKENAILHDENQRLQSENETLKVKINIVNEGPEPSMENMTPQEALGPIKIDGEDEYELEEIIACKLFQNKLHYKVSWVGYDPDDEWYPASNFKNSPYAIRTYHEKHPHGPPPPKYLEEWTHCFEMEETHPEYSDDDSPAEA